MWFKPKRTTWYVGHLTWQGHYHLNNQKTHTVWLLPDSQYKDTADNNTRTHTHTHKLSDVILMCCPSCCVRTLETSLSLPLSASHSLFLSLCLSLALIMFWLPITSFCFQLLWRNETPSSKKLQRGSRTRECPLSFPLSLSLSLSSYFDKRKDLSFSGPGVPPALWTYLDPPPDFPTTLPCTLSV